MGCRLGSGGFSPDTECREAEKVTAGTFWSARHSVVAGGVDDGARRRCRRSIGGPD